MKGMDPLTDGKLIKVESSVTRCYNKCHDKIDYSHDKIKIS